MIKLGGVGSALLLLVSVVGGCAGPGGELEPRLPTVPAGCDIAGTGVKWSAVVEESRLERASLYRTGSLTGEGEEVFTAPFTSAVTGVAAPDSWPAALAESLSAHVGAVVATGPTHAGGERVAAGREPRRGAVRIRTGGHQDQVSSSPWE